MWFITASEYVVICQDRVSTREELLCSQVATDSSFYIGMGKQSDFMRLDFKCDNFLKSMKGFHNN